MRTLVDANGPIIITANALMQRGGDIAYGFQQDASFWYLTGVDEPEVVLVMDTNGDYLIVPPREVVREAFDGAVDNDQLAQISGIQTILDQEAGWKKLNTRLKMARQFAMAAPNDAYIAFYGMYTNPARAGLLNKIQQIAPKCELVDIKKIIAGMRMIKQPEELKALQKAIDISIDAINDAVKDGKLSGYSHEYELEAAIAHGFRSRGASGHAFDPIVASGKSAAIIHSMSNNNPLKQGNLVIIDVGAEYQHYCADISRTYSVGSKPTQRQRDIFDAVQDVHGYARTLLKPGVLVREYEKQVEAYMGQKLVELKLITSSSHEAIRTYYPHACSHFLGLDPHDAGDYERPIEPGVILTVEPGIYIPDEGIGVRIEDDVVITADGCKLMSDRLTSDLTANA